MQRTTRLIVYPEGESQEIEHPLRVNQIVDLNGNPLEPHQVHPRMIVYRVYKISTRAARGEDLIQYHLELVWRDELESIAWEVRR